MSLINTRDIIGDQATLDGLVAHTLTELYEDCVSRLGSYACYNNTGLSYVEMPGITTQYNGASVFYSCTGLRSVSFPNMRSFGTYMFLFCSNLTTVYAPEATACGTETFRACTSLQSAVFPKMSTLGDTAFGGCFSLSSLSFSSSVTAIPRSAFMQCSLIMSVDFPNVTVINQAAFYSCTKLSTVSFPAAVNVGSGAFYNCPIGELVLPCATTLSNYITNMAMEIDLGSNPIIPRHAFENDYRLFSLILRNASMLTLINADALTATPIQAGCGKIYVPNELVNTYQSGTNWATYAAQIDSLDNYIDSAPIGDTITDDWATILTNNNYATDYSIGDTKWLPAMGGYVLMQIVAFDTDELADNTGYARITWLCKGYEGKRGMNSNISKHGGWASSDMRAWLINDVLPTIDATVRGEIKIVKKTYRITNPSVSTETSEDTLWIPSYREIFTDSLIVSQAETSGCVYANYFTSDSGRIKYFGCTRANQAGYWLRTESSDGYFVCTNFGGQYTYGTSNNEYGVVFGFCT